MSDINGANAAHSNFYVAEPEERDNRVANDGNQLQPYRVVQGAFIQFTEPYMRTVAEILAVQAGPLGLNPDEVSRAIHNYMRRHVEWVSSSCATAFDSAFPLSDRRPALAGSEMVSRDQQGTENAANRYAARNLVSTSAVYLVHCGIHYTMNATIMPVLQMAMGNSPLTQSVAEHVKGRVLSTSESIICEFVNTVADHGGSFMARLLEALQVPTGNQLSAREQLQITYSQEVGDCIVVTSEPAKIVVIEEFGDDVEGEDFVLMTVERDQGTVSGDFERAEEICSRQEDDSERVQSERAQEAETPKSGNTDKARKDNSAGDTGQPSGVKSNAAHRKGSRKSK